ncbi:hypothetical protein [Sulfurimonas sp.]
MKTFKSDYLKYSKSGYFDLNGIETIKYEEIEKRVNVKISDIEKIVNETKYKTEAAIIRSKKSKSFIIGKDKNRVNIPTKLIYGSEIIHSHPNGTSFSAEDIVETITFGGKQITAFNDEYLYVFKNNVKDDIKFIDTFNSVLSSTEVTLLKKVNNGTITKSQMDFSINHKVWLELSKMIRGFDYEAYSISR